MLNIEDVYGKTFEEVKEKYGDYYTIRVIDNVLQTSDYCENRLNVSVEGGRVVYATVG